MPNETIRRNMLLTGVSVSDLSDKLGLTDDETCGLLNTEMGIMQSFWIKIAIAEIAKERG